MASSKPIQCPLCWAGAVPPHRHFKSLGIPTTKDALIEGLLSPQCQRQMTMKHVREDLQPRTVKELKHLYKTTFNLVPHSACPVTRLTQLSRAELITLCKQHGLEVADRTKCGEMHCLLRQRWVDQCKLADQHPTMTPRNPQNPREESEESE